MDSGMSRHRLDSELSAQDDAAWVWPSVLNIVLGACLLSVGIVFGGPLFERLDTIAIGICIGLLGGSNLYHILKGNLEHPDILRVGVLASLWLVGFSLWEGPKPLGLLTDTSIVFGLLISVTNTVEFTQLFKNHPERRAQARQRTEMAVAAVPSRIRGIIRRHEPHALGDGGVILDNDNIRLNVIAIVVGIIAGLGAVVFRLTIYVVQEGMFGTILNPGSVSFAPRNIPNVFGFLAPLGPLRYLLIPAIGGILVGIVIHRTTPAVRGHGVPEVLESLMTENGEINPRISLYKTLASSLAIGSGASLGREGPIVQIGSAAGSYFGRFVDSRYTRTLVAAGAAGGIAATFNTPIAGIMFALEILLSEYYLKNVVVIVLGAVTATAVARSILGFTAAPGVHEFLIPIHYHIQTPTVEFPLYILLGFVVAVVGAAVVKLLYSTEHFFLERLELPGYVKPAIGGGILGLSVLLTALLLGKSPLQSGTWLFGVGYETIHSSIAGELTFAVLVVLGLMKAFGFALSIGSGSSGGVFSPSLYIGAMVGGAFGLLMNGIVSGTAGAGAYALVGTAGVFAATASAPLTATLIIFELTGQYTIILPLLVVTVIGSQVAQFLLNRGTIYTEKLREKGITVQERRIGSLEDLTAKDVMTSDVDTVQAGTSIERTLRVFQCTSHRGLPIVDEAGLAGMIVRSDLESVLTLPDGGASDRRQNSDEPIITAESRDRSVTPETPVEEIGSTDVVTATPQTNLLTLVDRMASADVGRVPIVDETGSIVGIVTRTDILAAYDQVPLDGFGDD